VKYQALVGNTAE
jgi:hypothetical protein